jgi:hypothetical protein
VNAVALRRLLRELRRVRVGSLDPTESTAPLSLYLGMGVGHLCDLLATWIERCPGADRRGVDAAISYYGLGRMPEELQPIAERLRHSSGSRAISPRQVENLRDDAVRKTARSSAMPGLKPSDEPIRPLVDPFPVPFTPNRRRRLDRILLWAWADAFDVRDGRALLFYELEHGLRASAPLPKSRTDKGRWRRRAQVMLDVAAYRLQEAVPTDPLVDRAAGPRQLAVVDTLVGSELDGLLALTISPYAVDVRQALQTVRHAVHGGRPEAPELLGILRDAILRLPRVPAEVTSKVLALTTIVARERRDPAGVLAGVQAQLHLRDVAQYGIRDHHSQRTVISDALRATQEAAQLQADLGEYTKAWHTARAIHEILTEFGDPEADEEPNGWHQQELLYAASLDRRLADQSHRPQRWLETATAASERSADLVFAHNALPITWGLAARHQRLGVAIDVTRQAQRAEDARLSNSVRAVRRRLDELETDWSSLPRFALTEADRLHVDRGLLATARAAWKIALIEGDPDEIQAARGLAWSRIGAWTTPGLIDKLAELDEAGRHAGVHRLNEPEIVMVSRERYIDRAHLRPSGSPP